MMNQFPASFLWGASSSAFQIEGGWDEGGKGMTVADFNSFKLSDKQADTKVASDFYHHWKEDIDLMKELDLKAAARAAGEKSVQMLHVKDLLRVTGYVRGGCSPVGMKKAYPTVIDEDCLYFDTILVSGGRIGLQIELSPEDLKRITGGTIAPVSREA